MYSNMDSKMVSIIFLILSGSVAAEIELGDVYFNDLVPSPKPGLFIVTDFGAMADGKTDNSEAFVTAWMKACSIKGSVVIVPPGIYLVKRATFEGPCNGETRFQIMGTIKASSNPSSDDDKDCWIMFYNVDGLTIAGYGTLDGNGESAWSDKDDVRSTSMKFVQVTNTRIQDINSINSKSFHVQIHESENIVAQNLTILAPRDSPNTDGIHIGHSNNVQIIDSHIATGDDCISIGDGSTNINITGIWCGPGHGISIGSLGKYKQEKDVYGITVRNCTFTDTQNGLRIKTWAKTSSPSVIKAYNITFVDINIYNADNPIIIDQYYCPHSSCGYQSESNVAIRDVKFINVQGHSAIPVAVNLRCSKSKPCQDIEFIGLNLTYKEQPATAVCCNADDKFIGAGQVPSTCSSLPPFLF